MTFKYFKASVSFEYDGKAYNFEDLDVTNEGVPEICKSTDNLNFKLNQILLIKIKPMSSFLSFSLKGKLFLNTDIDTKSFGINFVETSNDFNIYIDKNGKKFNKWFRSSPRINSDYFDKTFDNYKVEIGIEGQSSLVNLLLLNVSLGGIGVFGSITDTSSFKINSLTHCKFTYKQKNVEFKFSARVVRITTNCEYDKEGKQIYINHIGLKFVNFDAADKKIFLETVGEVIRNFHKA